MKLTRDVTVAECPWLPYDLAEGREVEEYHGPTYGVIGDGIAVILDGTNTFHEVPWDSVDYGGSRIIFPPNFPSVAVAHPPSKE